MVLRELSSIYRSDLSLICSREELRILREDYGVPRDLLAMGSFFYPPALPRAGLDGLSGTMDLDQAPAGRGDQGIGGEGDQPRKHFVFIGTFKHAPNVDAVMWLSQHIWPQIRSQIPDAECHVYGSYATSAVTALHKPSLGFHVKGHAPDLDMLWGYRVGLAPLRFGAGIKGKILDSWRHGLPVVTTPIGAEGLCDAPPSRVDGPVPAAAGAHLCGSPESTVFRGGLGTAVTAEDLAADAVRLYRDAEIWRQSAEQGRQHLERWFDEDKNGRELLASLEWAFNNRHQQRRNNFVGGMLWMNGQRATEFFSRWLELKESLK